MNEDVSLKDLERKVFLSYHNDGLLDVLIGIIIVGFAVSLMLDSVVFIAPLAAMASTFLTIGKKRITVPRIGTVHFNPERERKIAHEKHFFVLFFLATFLIGIAVFYLMTNRESSFESLLRTFIFAPMGIIGAAGFSFLAYWKELKRYYIYALLILLTVFGGPFIGVEPPTYLLYGGLTILIPGILVLVQFLKKYPHPGKEA